MNEIERIVIVGGGQAGASAAARLRGRGFGGTITLVCREPIAPYQRPPLSKKYLIGEMDRDRLLIKPAAFYKDSGVDLRTGVEATAIDRDSREITLSDGSVLAWDRLLLCTGTKPHMLPTAMTSGLENVHTIRTIEDVDQLQAKLATAKHVLVVGGGYIGLEAAAVVRQLGIAASIVEAGQRILQRVAAQATSRRIAQLHRGNGVEIFTQTGLQSLEPLPAGRCRARLDTGTERVVELVIVGIGVAPETALAAACGLTLDNGVAVDTACRTSDPRIFAAGDCASFPWRGERIRLESVQNAIDQAEAAADSMLGHDVCYDPVPWFWSNQFDVKLQIAGLNRGYEQVVERPGRRESTGSVWYFAGDQLLAVDAFNDGAAYMTGKRLLEARRSPPVDQIGDPAKPLKGFLG